MPARRASALRRIGAGGRRIRICRGHSGCTERAKLRLEPRGSRLSHRYAGLPIHGRATPMENVGPLAKTEDWFSFTGVGAERDLAPPHGFARLNRQSRILHCNVMSLASKDIECVAYDPAADAFVLQTGAPSQFVGTAFFVGAVDAAPTRKLTPAPQPLTASRAKGGSQHHSIPN
jgi:hypothetical protein